MEANPEHAVNYGIFTRQQALAAGISAADIDRHLHRGAWMRSSRGTYEIVGRPTSGTDDLARTVLQAGGQAVVGLLAAARVYGWDLPAVPELPAVLVPHGHSPRIPALRARLAGDDVVCLGSMLVTSPARTAADLAAKLDRDVAVVVLDSALRAGLRLDDLREAIRRRRSPAARRVSALVDPCSGSVPESQARLIFLEARLPKPHTQFVVLVAGMICRADFAWPLWRLIVEIDGREHHIGAGPFQTDRTRQNALLQAGWLVLRFTVDDVRLRPQDMIAQIRHALLWRPRFNEQSDRAPRPRKPGQTGHRT